MLPKRDADDIVYQSTKTYAHNIGFSCAFRQWRAESHCRFIHGYALQFRLVFASKELDVRNWVVDFGSLKSFKGWLEDMFDHTLLIAEDDPMLSTLRRLGDIQMQGERWSQLAQVRVVPSTGCEATARLVFEYLEGWLMDNGYSPRVWLESVEVSEHAGNSALVVRK